MLIQILLTEDPIEINNWRERLQSRLGINGKIVTDVIPELELIIGKQSPVPFLEPNENSNRFYLIFQDFIGIFCTLNHPLVLFLDDMQWADPASLQMIKNLMSDKSLKYILIILSYRTTEDNQNNPFLDMIDSLKKDKIYPKTIRLKPIGIEDITELLADSFHSKLDGVKDLADIIFQKTSGNPFFINELIKKLANDKKIYLDESNGKWQWDIQKIESIKLPANIIDLLVNKIERLPNYFQEVLKNCACIGTRFNLWIISIILNKSFKETMEILYDLIRQDYLQLPLESIKKITLVTKEQIDSRDAKEIYYQFHHDRIQQAAYELIEEDERKKIQLSIGRFLWRENFSEDNLFDIVNHLNYGHEKNTSIDENKELIILNLRASQKAKLSTAYDSALVYLQQALSLLKDFPDPWTNMYTVTVQVYRELTELYFLNIQFDKLEECIAEILLHTEDLFQVTHSYKLLINYYTTVSKYSNAVECGLEGLELFGIILPKEDYNKYINDELKQIKKI